MSLLGLLLRKQQEVLPISSTQDDIRSRITRILDIGSKRTVIKRDSCPAHLLYLNNRPVTIIPKRGVKFMGQHRVNMYLLQEPWRVK